MISYDPNLRLSLWSDEAAARAGMLLGLEQAEIVKLSEDELEFLTGGKDFEKSVEDIRHENLKLLVLTRGKQGCRFWTPAASGEVATFEIDAVDTTGAGDAFVAGLLQGIVRNPRVLQDPEELHNLCRFANAAGALTATALGAIPALPGLRDVEKFLHARELPGYQPPT